MFSFRSVSCLSKNLASIRLGFSPPLLITLYPLSSYSSYLFLILCRNASLNMSDV